MQDWGRDYRGDGGNFSTWEEGFEGSSHKYVKKRKYIQEEWFFFILFFS